MARIGINYEQVAEIANTITATGNKATIESIRNQLGGSPNTIHRHLTTWRLARQAEPAKCIDLPPAIAGAIMEEIKKAEKATKAQTQEQLTELQKEADELSATGEKLELLIEELEIKLRETETALAEQITQNQEKSREIERLQREVTEERNTVKEAYLTQAKTVLELEELGEKRKAVKQLHNEINSLSMQVQVQQIALDQTSKEIEKTKQESKEYKESCKTAINESAELRGMLKAYREMEQKKEAIKPKTPLKNKKQEIEKILPVDA